MANKISELTAASTPLAGTELVWVEQGGLPRKSAVSDFISGTSIGSLSDVDLTGLADNDLLWNDNGTWKPSAGRLSWDPALDLFKITNGTDYFQIDVDSTQTFITAKTPFVNIDLNDATTVGWFWYRNGAGVVGIRNADTALTLHDNWRFKLHGLSDTNRGEFWHDDTDFNTAFNATTDWNITGLSSGGMRVDGEITGLSGVIISDNSAFATYRLVESGETTNNKVYDILAASKVLSIRLLDDALGSATDVIRILRNGLTSSEVEINASLLDFNGPADFSQNVTGHGLFISDAAAPGVRFIETGVTANNTTWDIRVDNENFSLRNLTDGAGSQNTFFQAERTGQVIDRILMTATEVELNGTLDFNGDMDVSGKIVGHDAIKIQGTYDTPLTGVHSFLDVVSAADGRVGSATTSGVAAPLDVWGSVVTLVHGGTDVLVTQSQTATGNTSAAQVLDHGGTFRDIGFNELNTFNMNASDTLEAQHAGKVTGKTDTTSYTLTGPTSSDLDFQVGAVCTLVNLGSSVDYTINDTATCTMFIVGSGAVTDIAGSCTLGPGGIATLWRYDAATIYIWGSGLTA